MYVCAHVSFTAYLAILNPPSSPPPTPPPSPPLMKESRGPDEVRSSSAWSSPGCRHRRRRRRLMLHPGDVSGCGSARHICFHLHICWRQIASAPKSKAIVSKIQLQISTLCGCARRWLAAVDEPARPLDVMDLMNTARFRCVVPFWRHQWHFWLSEMRGVVLQIFNSLTLRTTVSFSGPILV